MARTQVESTVVSLLDALDAAAKVATRIASDTPPKARSVGLDLQHEVAKTILMYVPAALESIRKLQNSDADPKYFAPDDANANPAP